VTNVLVVSARQLGDPVTFVISMKADDGAPHHGIMHPPPPVRRPAVLGGSRA
jgi:hypothetical protein